MWIPVNYCGLPRLGRQKKQGLTVFGKMIRDLEYLLRKRKGNNEGAAFSQHTFGLDGSAMGQHHGFHIA